MTIIAITFPMMHTGSRQMSEPPDHQKEHKEQMIHTIYTTNMALFPIPSTTFEVLRMWIQPPNGTDNR